MFKWILVALVPAAVAAFPLFQPGFIPTHDGEYHIIRFWQFEKMLQTGVVIPRWAPDMNSGYGVPVFIFNYPLPNYFGAIFHSLGFSYPDAFKLTLAFGYLLAVFLCFLWLSKLFGPFAAIIGTAIFSYIPYWFVEIYVRGSVGEVLAIAWVLLAFLSIERNWKQVLALSVAAVILSHNILAIAFLPLIIGYLLARNKLAFFVWFLVGVGAATYFWLPALAERSFVVGLNPVDFRSYFASLDQILIPSWGTGFADSSLTGNQMSLQIGVVPLLILLLSFFFTKKEKDVALLRLGLLFLGVSVVSILLTQRITKPIWEIIAILPFWQYPWRWLAMLIPSTAFLSSFLASKGLAFSGLLAVIAIIIAYPYSRPVVYSPRDDTYYLALPNLTDGTSSLGNSFSTAWLPWQPVRPKEKIEISNGLAKINTSYYPGWKVLVDGKEQFIEYESNGLINVKLPSDSHNIVAVFAETPLRKAADIISLLSLLWLGGSAILDGYANRHRRDAPSKRT